MHKQATCREFQQQLDKQARQLGDNDFQQATK